MNKYSKDYKKRRRSSSEDEKRHKKHKDRRRRRSKSRSKSREKYYKSYKDEKDHPSSSKEYHEKRRDSSHHRSKDEGKYREDHLEFSFEIFKSELNRIFFSGRENLIKDLADFWQFVNKYEAVLKKNGKPILQKKSDGNNIKIDCINFKLKASFDELLAKLPLYDEDYDRNKMRLNRDMVEQFLDIIMIYVDFKNKEKFTKLKNLRKLQKDLPVYEYKDKIIEAVKNDQVVIIAGDTGCGKSTQIPQYLSEAGFMSIACTQPRRIACISLAKRVAYESLTQYGSEVGYQIRFERSRNQGTKICFITEGLLLRQVASESSLSTYDVIILDEIHERHLHGDFLLGILKCLLHSRRDLKLVLMSATINIQLFANYFADEQATVIEVPGRLYPIQLHYRPIFVEGRQSKAERLDPQPYVQIMQMIDDKYPKDEKGDLLIFLSGMQEITSICEAAKQYAEKSKTWIVLPLHSTMSIADQDKVFDYPPDGVRKCIVSTNIAETSVTIDGIRFVVDSGKVKEMSYDPSCKMQRLKEFWISKSSAEQRKGRAGRTGPGVCYRIYSEKEYSALEAFSTPELLRVPLDSLLLLMVSLGLNDVRQFPFIDPPPEDSVENALLELKQHNALTSNEKLTPLGKALSRLPVEIVLGKMLILGSVMLQSDAVLSLAASLSVQSPYTNRAHRDIDCETARKPLESDHGDPLILLNLYSGWLQIKQESSSSYSGRARGSHEGGDRPTNSRHWCKRRRLEEQRFYEITKLRSQFNDLLQDCGLLDLTEPETMSSAERALRHGQLKQLKDLKRQHKSQSAEESRKRRRLKMEMWEVEGEGFPEDSGGPLDIKDVEFQLANDMKKVQNLISGSSASSHRDLSTLKLVLCRALYPQIAVADEYNHCKSVSEQLFHTSNKSFVSLHPMSYFGAHPHILQLGENEIEMDVPGYKSKLPLSSKHQILCYLSLLETTKPYLMNSMRMPAAQTLLLFAHCIDTNLSFSRLVCDSWLQLEFPTPESGLNLLLKASQLRRQWDDLINDRLEGVETSVESALQEAKPKLTKTTNQKLQYELSVGLSSYLATEVCYTIKRLLPADLKTMFNDVEVTEAFPDVIPNPFNKDFKCFPHEKKAGVWLDDHIVFGSLMETEWSLAVYDEIMSTSWSCPQCSLALCLSPLEKLQHRMFTCGERGEEDNGGTDMGRGEEEGGPRRPNSQMYTCDKCSMKKYLTPVEILRHKKTCN